jgi:hypothetical protein
MPIKTRISVGADAAQIKASLAEFEKYRAALAKMYGDAALKAPHIATASAAGGDLLKFIDLDAASRSQSTFAAGSSKAARAFHSLHTGILRLVERQSQSSAMSGLMPGGMRGLQGIGVMAGPIGVIATTLIGLGVAAGVAGIAAFRGLASGAAGVTDRRRFAMGIGSGYGEVAGFGLDFARFGADQGTLGAVAGGLYDVTSPQRIGLMTAGVTGGKDAVETAVELIRKIPEMLKGVDGGAVGPVAKSMGLLDILDLPTIVRLKNHPEEIEDQVKKFQGDKITLDMSAKATEAWASFTAELDRDGLKIEAVLGKSLVGLTPGLTHLSEEMVDIVGELIKSDALKNGLKGAESGLERLGGYLGSDKFKRDEDRFLSGLAALEPYGPKLGKIIMLGYNLSTISDEVLNGLLAAAQGNGAALRAWLIKKFGLHYLMTGANNLVGEVVGTVEGSLKSTAKYVFGDGGPDAPGLTGTGAPSIRYGTGRGQSHQPSAVIDSTTGRPVPSGGGSGWNASAGDIPPDLLAQVQKENPHLTPGQCVELVQSMMHVGNVHDWRRGLSEKDSPAGAALATFGVHGDSDRYAYGGSGTPGIGRGHAVKLVKKYPDGSFDAISQDIGHSPHLIHIPNTGKGGEGDASSYFQINDPFGRPAGDNAKLPAGPPRASTGAHAGHILNHMAPPPPKPVTIQDHSGGMVQFSIA